MTNDILNLLTVGVVALIKRRGSMPSGHLYALLMSEKSDINLQEYQTLVSTGERLEVWSLSKNVLTLEKKGVALAETVTERLLEVQAVK